MKQIGIRGAVRGKAMKTTIPDTSAPCPRDKVNRTFRAPAPNLLWVSDFTYVSTTARQCIAEQCHERGGRALSMWPSSSIRSLIASWAPSRQIWRCQIACRSTGRVSRSAKTDFVLPYRALLRNTLPGNGCLGASPARSTARPEKWTGSPFGSPLSGNCCTMPCRAVGGQYLSIRYTERLAEAGIEPSVGSVGDSYDNALAETINGLYKTELVHRQGPWRNMQDLEMATLGWVDWFNHRRLLGPIGNIPPAEAEQNFYAQRDVLDMVA